MSRRERQRRQRRNEAGPQRAIFLALGLLLAVAPDRRAAASSAGSSASRTRLRRSIRRKPIEQGATSRVYAADGTRLGFIQADDLRTPVSSHGDPAERSRTPTVAIEDRRFYEHQGVDFEGIVRAASRTSRTATTVQGGSTLTMQLVRNLYTRRPQAAHAQAQDPRGQARRGPREPAPGREGKHWILTKYLNNVPYGTVGGQTAVGVQAARAHLLRQARAAS